MNYETHYWKITELWKKFCEKHIALFHKTSEEYSYLLSSELEKLEVCTKEKNKILISIANLEKSRQKIINEINGHYGEKKISYVTDLIEIMAQLEVEKEKKHLFKFNKFLKNIIEKIQFQNRKNQLFINKALHSLQAIREDTLGNKNYSGYNAHGIMAK